MLEEEVEEQELQDWDDLQPPSLHSAIAPASGGQRSPVRGGYAPKLGVPVADESPAASAAITIGM